MNKLTIGKELKSKLENGDNIIQISRWAFRVFSENIRSLDRSLRETLQEIFSMQEDPQFELTITELHKLADELIKDGEKEELSKHIPEIKDTAIELAEYWVMCPLCQESWEISSNYPMVFCPKCDQKLHNPKFKS